MSNKIPLFKSPEGEKEYFAAYDAALKQWPVPYEELYISTGLGDTHVIASGPKNTPPLVLLHPPGASATIWYRNVGAFSEHYRTYAVDTISEPNKSILTHPINRSHQCQQFAGWMTDLLKGLQIDKTHIVGNSFGGFLALNTVLHIPERIKKAVLISPAATFVQMWAWYWHFIPANMIGPLVGSKRMLLAAYEWIWQDFPQDDNLSRLRTATAIHGHPRHWFPSVFSDEELLGVRTPLLLLIGDREVIYEPDRVIRRATRMVTGLKAEIVSKANHNAEYTAADVINEKIILFLSER
jgi:pimeloyl-ACP methyl ester carboxylesterase